MYECNTLVSVILKIISFFSINDLFGRNYWPLLTIGYFFGKFNAYFDQRNEELSFYVKDAVTTEQRVFSML